MMNFDTLNPASITPLAVSVILFTLAVFLIVEVFFTKSYLDRFELDQKAIKFLEKKRREIQTPQRLTQYLDITLPIQDTQMTDWFSHYLDWKIDKQAFQARIEHNKFVFLIWPSRFNYPVPHSPGHFVPTLLTTLGILGTFVGVSIGLQGIDLQSSNDFVTLQENSTELLGGLKTAFYSSAVGMIAAILAILSIALGNCCRQQKRNCLRKQLSAIAVLETPTHFLSRMDNQSSQDAAQELKQAAQILSQLDMPGAEAIGSHVANALKPTFMAISDDLSGQRKAIEAQRQELLTNLIGELRTEIVEPVAQRLDASASMTRDASGAVRELKNELGGISQSLATSVETIQLFQTKTLEELQQFANSLQKTLNDFQSETKGVLNQVATDVRSAVDQSIEGMKIQRTAFEESAERASQVMDTARENLHSTLSNIDDMLRNTRITVQEELEKFRDGYQGSLTTFFAQQNEQLSGLLDQQRQGLTNVVEELRQVFQNDAQVMAKHINDSMTNVRETAKTVGDLVNTLGLKEGHQMVQLKELAKEMGDEVQRIETSHTKLIKQIDASYQNMSQQLQQALVNGNEQLSKYLNDAGEVYSRNLEDFDRDAAKVCQGLENTSAQFIGVAEYLIAATKELNSSQSSQNDDK